MRIKNWKEFQHFKDRTPPWIKLYRDILNDPEWHSLDGESAKSLVMIWLIASEDKSQCGNIPDVKTLAFRLRKTEKEVNQLLTKINHYLIQDDINLISECHQHDAPETETETETESIVTSKAADDCPHEKIISLYHEILPVLPAVKIWNDKRKALLKSRWREDTKRQDLEFWKRFFGYVSKSDFLTGRSTDFMSSLEWMLNSKNFIKIIEGNYENRNQQS